MNEELLIENAERQEVFKLKATLAKYARKWPWILISVIISITISIFYLQFKSNQYRVESKVFIKKSQQFNDPSELLFGGRGGFRRPSVINDETVMFKSFPLVKSVLEELKFDVTYKKKGRFKNIELYKESPILIEFDRKLNKKLPYSTQFQIEPKGANEFSLKTIKMFEGELLDGIYNYNQPIKLGSFSFKIRKNTNSTIQQKAEDIYFIRFSSITNISYSYRNLLKFDKVEGMSSILTMSMKTTVPEKSIDFINALIGKYIQQSLDEKNKVAKNTVDFIDQQLASISDSLNKKEQNLENFRSSEGISDLGIEGTMIVEQYNQIENERAQYEIKQQYYDYLQKNLKDGQGSNIQNLIAPSAFGIQDLIVNDLVKTLIELNITKANLENEGNTKGALLDQVKSRIIQITKTLDESIINLSNANQIILSKLNGRTSKLITSAKKLPSSQRQLVNLNRLLQLNENIYLFLMEKRSSAAITMSSNTADCRVIEPAMLNPISPIAPNRRMVYMVAVIIGIFLPLIFFILVDFLNDTIRSKEELESGTQVPIIGTVPQTDIVGTSMVVSQRPKSAVAESFRIIRSNLSFFQGKKSPFVILMTSSVAKEGKTYCALNLASILASTGKKTVLLGFDLRKPQLHNYLDIPNGKGISNYITGQVNLDEILLPTDEKHLSLINSGTIPPNPAELLMKDRTKELIEELKERFDYIIMDTPPIGIVTDALILKEFSDVNLFVVRQDYSQKSFLNELNELNASKRLQNLSIIFNDVSSKGNYGNGYYEEEKVKGGNTRRLFGKSRKS